MRWIAAIAGLLLFLALAQDSGALPGELSKSKRSIDLNDLYHSKLRQHRLPKEITPVSYHLELQPFVGNDKFKGRVRINVTWIDTTDRITLNVHPDLQISQSAVRVTELSPEEKAMGLPLLDVNIARTELPHSGKPWYTIHLEQMLKKGSTCEVDISFTGNLTKNETSGFFKSEYPDSEGKMHSLVATYLRLNHAQRMFPCMDEPEYKATFKLSVLRPKDLTARSNTAVESCTEEPGDPNLFWDHFEKTPRMSTYQLALVVSDLESISPTTEMYEMNGTKLQIKVWGRKDYLETLKDIPDKVVKIMNFLQYYFNSSILLTKLDVMAIPMYNAPKASDSWGLMFFKESELCSSSIWNTAYELIYQWIGQYITPFSWSSAPVNKALNSFLASRLTVGMNPDEMEGKWPMTMLYSLYYEFGSRIPFSRVAGIMKDATSAKTELIFRMFEYTLSPELFQRSMRNFIRQNSEEYPGTFFADDIYSCLNDVANETNSLPPGLTINSIAAPWINRDRVPLVTVTRDYETKNITLSQKVYLREIPPVANAKVSYQWDIPIVMVSQDNLEFKSFKPTTWLTRGNEPKNLTIPDITDQNNFVIVNPEEIGMFPVNYDVCNWKMLSVFLRGPGRETIPVLTRAKLLHDSWNLAYAGELCFEIALNMTLFLKEERSHVVWEPVFTMIDHIGRRIEESKVYPKFEAYIRTLLKPLYVELGETAQPGEPSWKVHMRGLAKNFLCRAGYEPCVKEARDQFKKWLTDEEPDKGNPVANEFICPVFKWGTQEEWEFGLQRVINFPLERKQNERTYLLKTLAGCPKDPYKIERLLNVTVLNQNGNFTDSDINLIFSMLAGGSAGYTTLFNFLSDHWDTLKMRYSNKKHLWDSIINSATSSFNTEDGYCMVRDFYKVRSEQFDSAEHIIREALWIMELEAKWSQENLPVIDAWLTENLPKEELQAIEASTSTTTTTPTPTTTTTAIRDSHKLLSHLASHAALETWMRDRWLASNRRDE